jgi:hypothetical protein
MAKYLQRSCPRCGDYLESGSQTKPEAARARDQWTVFEMWISACVGAVRSKNVNTTKPTMVQHSLNSLHLFNAQPPLYPLQSTDDLHR